MKTIKTMIKDTKKKAFTLIELLIVVAIIGILAGVGVPMYNGYMANAKIQSSATNHANVKSFVAATLTKCSAGSTSVTLGSTARACSANTEAWAGFFRSYFDTINKNPYGGSVVTSNTDNPAIGVTSIFHTTSPNRIRLKTNVGDEDGGNSYAPATAYDYITKE